METPTAVKTGRTRTGTGTRTDVGSGRALAETPGSSRLVWKVALVNLVVGVAGIALTAFYWGSAAAGFAAGFAVSAANVLWLFRIAAKGVLMEPEKAGRYVTFNYYVRFAVTALVFLGLVAKGVFEAWPVVTGLTVCVAATVASVIYAAKEEAGE